MGWGHAQAANTLERAAVYVRRWPERSAAYQVVRENLETWPASKQLDRPCVTTRLWRRCQGPGSGLGLWILQALCECYGAELKLQLRNIGGLTVCLALALAPMSNNHQLSL